MGSIVVIHYLKTAHHFVSISLKSKSNHELTEHNALANRSQFDLSSYSLMCAPVGGDEGGHYGWDLVRPCYRKRLCKPYYDIPLVSSYIQTFLSTINT